MAGVLSFRTHCVQRSRPTGGTLELLLVQTRQTPGPFLFDKALMHGAPGLSSEAPGLSSPRRLLLALQRGTFTSFVTPTLLQCDVWGFGSGRVHETGSEVLVPVAGRI